MLHPFRVTLFGRADVVIVRNSHPLPEFLELSRNLIRILLWSFSGSLRRALDFLAMLIGASQKKRFCAEHALAPRNRIARDGRISMADVRPRIHVINRCRNVELLAHVPPFSINAIYL